MENLGRFRFSDTMFGIKAIYNYTYINRSMYTYFTNIYFENVLRC